MKSFLLFSGSRDFRKIGESHSPSFHALFLSLPLFLFQRKNSTRIVARDTLYLRERMHAHSQHPAMEAELIALYLIKPRIISLTRADLYSSFLPLQRQASLPSFTIFHLHPFCTRDWKNRSRQIPMASPLVRQPLGFCCISLSLSFSRFFLHSNLSSTGASSRTIVTIITS